MHEMEVKIRHESNTETGKPKASRSEVPKAAKSRRMKENCQRGRTHRNDKE